MKNSIYLIFIFSFFLFSCSAVQESETDDSKNVYVFDDISVKDSTNNYAEEVTEPVQSNNVIIEMYIVQVGAFSTLEKAETFVSSVKDKTNYDLNIHLRDSDNLHVIQLPPFRTREEAEIVRDELRNFTELEGTFIVPNNKSTNLEEEK